MKLARHRHAGLLAAAIAAVLGLAACSGVPKNSVPVIVHTVDGAGQQPAAEDAGPTPGEDPRSIVRDFFAEAVTSTSAARQFLTLDAQRTWQPNPVVIVSDEPVIGNPASAGATDRVTVTAGTQVGQLDATGVYTPTRSSAPAAAAQSQTVILKQIDGQWRIDSPPQGLLVGQSTFDANYHPYQLYFFDNAQTALIADQRYSALSNQQLLSWLMVQTLAGPRPELATAVVNEIPPQVDHAKVVVTDGDPIQVEMPGAGQTDSGRVKLAQQLAFTLGVQPPLPSRAVTITDGGRPLVISASEGSTFSSNDWPGLDPENLSPAGGPFYLHDGQLIYAATQTPVSGPLGAPRLGLSVIAVQGSDPDNLRVLATSRTSVLLGASKTGYAPVAGLAVAGLGQPDWQPHTTNVWIGGPSGGVYVISATTGAHKPVAVAPTPGGAAAQGQIAVLSFSPDGSRLAAVVHGGQGADSVWVGSVVATGNTFRIDSFEPITPASVDVTGVAWRDDSALFVLGSDPISTSAAIWTVSSDGSQLTSISLSGLPGAPVSIAAGLGQPAIAAAGGTLSERAESGWQALSAGPSYTYGTDPVYSH
jgi:hypothetical protein